MVVVIGSSIIWLLLLVEYARESNIVAAPFGRCVSILEPRFQASCVASIYSWHPQIINTYSIYFIGVVRGKAPNPQWESLGAQAP